MKAFGSKGSEGLHVLKLQIKPYLPYRGTFKFVASHGPPRRVLLLTQLQVRLCLSGLAALVVVAAGVRTSRQEAEQVAETSRRAVQEGLAACLLGDVIARQTDL